MSDDGEGERWQRIHELLDEAGLEVPDDSGAVWTPEAASATGLTGDEAVVVCLGPREWDSLGSRASLTFREDVEVEVVKGEGPGAGFSTSEGAVTGVQAHLPGEALRTLHDTGRWSYAHDVGGAALYIGVVVLADA